jgi:hypothetical protein
VRHLASPAPEHGLDATTAALSSVAMANVPSPSIVSMCVRRCSSCELEHDIGQLARH